MWIGIGNRQKKCFKIKSWFRKNLTVKFHFNFPQSNVVMPYPYHASLNIFLKILEVLFYFPGQILRLINCEGKLLNTSEWGCWGWPETRWGAQCSELCWATDCKCLCTSNLLCKNTIINELKPSLIVMMKIKGYLLKLLIEFKMSQPYHLQYLKWFNYNLVSA